MEKVNDGSGGNRGRRDSIIGEFMARKYGNKRNSALRVEDDGDFKSVSNRELIHGVASSFFEAAYQRLKSSKGADAVTIDDDYEEFVRSTPSESSDSFWKDDNFRQDYEINSEAGSSQQSANSNVKERGSNRQSKKSQEHFIDILLDKMVSTILPNNFPEREHFSQRVNDPERKKRQKLSATILTRNLKVLTTKLGSIFELQDSIIRLLAWRNPSGTITMLVFITMICFNPVYLAIIPVLYVLYGLMIPGYIHRHPPRRSAFLSRRTFGKSLIVSIASGGKRTNTPFNDDVQEYEYNYEMDPHDIQRAHQIKQSMEFVVNLRDLQNSMSTMVSLSNSLEKFIYGTAGFKDEHRSTALFLVGLVTLTISWLVSPLINWSAVSASAIWSAMLAVHPKIRPKLAHLIKKEQLERGKEALKRTERYDIILDEQPEAKYIEVFEIYKQGVVPEDWSFLKYSSSVFDPDDNYRRAQVPPPGVDTLDQVHPPLTWSFDSNTSWEVDHDTVSWASERGLDIPVDGEFLIDDSFKRRRLTRKVLRYANPARKPSYK